MSGNQDIRDFEPIFGKSSALVIMPGFQAQDELCRRFGPDGGLIMDYACGVVSFRKYMMTCEISGIDDYDVGLLNAIYEYLSEYAEKIQRAKELGLYTRPDTECLLKKFKTRLFQLKYEISKLNLMGVDNL